VIDFFISYTSRDRLWAEWITRVLDEAGYSTKLQARDFAPGQDFVQEMQQAATTAARTMAVLSPAYFDSRFTGSEWAAAFAQDPTGELRTLIPVRVADFEPPGLLRSRIYVDLVDKNEEGAREALLQGVAAAGVTPKQPAPFPPTLVDATELPRFPGSLPAIWNVPFRRNQRFTGRDRSLQSLYERFVGAGQLNALVLIGPAGVGKTQLAVEYAYRHAADYDLVWWVRAQDPSTLLGDYAALAEQLPDLDVDPTNQHFTVSAVRDALDRKHRWL
jgi:TIR domain